MAIMNREQILSAPVLTQDVEVMEWGGSVRVRSMTARARTMLLDCVYENERAMQAYNADQELPDAERTGSEPTAPLDHSILRVLFAIVDDDNEPLFSLDDYDAFRDLSYSTIVQLWTAVSELDKPKASPEALKKTSE